MTLKNCLKILAFFTAFIILYHDALRLMFSKWFTPDGSHGPLIVGVSLYLIWINRKKIRSLPAKPGLLPGSILIGMGCLMLISGKFGFTMLMQQLSMIPVLLGTIWLFGGFSLFKVFLIPVGYLIFLMGIIEMLLSSISIYLQIISARIAYHILELIGYSVLLKSTIIELPHITMEVVRACSGVNHIVSLLAFAVVLAYITQRTLVGKCLLVFLAFPVGIFANGVRVALIGVYNKYFPGSDIHGPEGTLVTSFIFFFGLIGLGFFSMLLKNTGLNRATNSSYKKSLNTEFQKNNEISASGFAPLILAIIMFSVTLFLVHFHHPEPVYLKNSLYSFPVNIGDFKGEIETRADERLRPVSADKELLRSYRNDSGKSFDLYVGYFTVQTHNRKVMDYRRKWMHIDPEKVPVTFGEDTLLINRTRFPDTINSPDIYFWYIMDEKIVTNKYETVFLTFWNGLSRARNNASVIIIKTTNSENEIMPFIKDLVPMINKHLLNI